MTGTQSTSFSRPGVSPRRTEHQFFAWSAAFVALLVFVGFARTYYLQSLFRMPDLSTFLRFHAAVMTGWIALFVAQTLLITSNRRHVHRVLGMAGASYAAIVVAMGTAATVLSARREVRAHSDFVSSFLTVLALELTQMLLFASWVTLAVWFRNRTDYHKRLMLLATLCMLPNPTVRLLLMVGVQRNIVMLSVWALLVMAIVLVDSITNRRLHPAFGLGGTLTIALLYLAYFASLTSLWQHSAAAAVG